MTENRKEVLAHIRDSGEAQLLTEHLTAVSEFAGQFASKIGLKETGGILGLLHDFGKANELFQNYLLSGEGFIPPDEDEYIDPKAMRGKIDHSTAGAQIIFENLTGRGSKEEMAAQILALCIASHHSGLIDCLTPEGENNFDRRMKKPDEDTHKTEAVSNLQAIENELAALLSEDIADQVFVKLKSLQGKQIDSKETLTFKIGLLIRFLLSCLIDADRLDTADFEAPGNIDIRNYGEYLSWDVLIQRLDAKLSEFAAKEKRNQVDELRTQVSQACFDFASKPQGIYQLTVPTGGGKTLASLRFALNHAAHHGLDRVFYVIPYTSIIDQNADEIRKILENKDERGNYLDQVVLEHHSNLTPEEESYRQGLLSQNWDAPVVLTTQVQFLESLFGSGTRGVRRMHQLANSVIILDEVQTIPIKTIQMLNVALRFLAEDCGATVILCTATQPPLDKIDAQYRRLTIQSDQRIIQDEQSLYKSLKRVEAFDMRRAEGWDEEQVAELAIQQLEAKGSMLIVVNTKKSARLLFQTIRDKKIDGLNLYHLSTNMCPAHRLNILEQVKKRLYEEPVICVSTQLIEAGVDIDFGAVIRYLAGLDSIAQSAGRCNRHGVRSGLGNVWIVNPKEENISPLQDIVIGREQTQRVLDDFLNDPQALEGDCIGLEAMATYYRYYYHMRKDDMRYKVSANSPIGREDDLFNLLSSNTISVDEYKRIHKSVPNIAFRQSFQSAAKAFQVIDSPARGVIVPYQDRGQELIADLCSASMLQVQRNLLREAQRYSVNLFPHEFRKLYEIEAIHEVQKGTGIFYLQPAYYCEELGWTDESINDSQALFC